MTNQPSLKIGGHVFKRSALDVYIGTVKYKSHDVEVVLDADTVESVRFLGAQVDSVFSTLVSTLKRVSREIEKLLSKEERKLLKVSQLRPAFLQLSPHESRIAEYEFGFSLYDNGIEKSKDQDRYILLGGNLMDASMNLDVSGLD